MGQLPGQPRCDSRWGYFVGAQRTHAHAQPDCYNPGDTTELNAGDAKPRNSVCHSYANCNGDGDAYTDANANLAPHIDCRAHTNTCAYRDIYIDTHIDTHLAPHEYPKPLTRRASSRLYEMEPYLSSLNRFSLDRFGLWAACISKYTHAGECSCCSGRQWSEYSGPKRKGNPDTFPTHCADANPTPASCTHIIT